MRAILLAPVILALNGCAGIFVHKEDIITYKVETTREELMQRRKQPDKVIVSDLGEEEWVYESDVHFSGVVVWLGIPLLPLVIPNGRHYEKYIFKQDSEVVLVKRQHGIPQKNFYGCGYVCIESCGFFCMPE